MNNDFKHPDDDSDEPEFSITGPDGQPASASDFVRALEDAGRAKDDQMSCPVVDCPGRIQAACGIWFDVSPEGLPYVHGVGWYEGGEIICSEGGKEHVPPQLERQLWETLFQFCASLEKRVGSRSQEDNLTSQVIWGEGYDKPEGDQPNS